MPRQFLPGLLCMAMAVGGCSRTDDGTVVIPEQLDMRRVDLGPLDLRHPGRMRPEQQGPLIMPPSPEPFPISPQAKAMGDRRPGARTSQRRRQPVASGPADPFDTLACKPAQRTGQRVQVRCE